MELKQKLNEANEAITGLRQDASTAWSAFESAKSRFAESGSAATDTKSDAFKALDEAGKTYGAKADALADAERGRDALLRVMSIDGVKADDPAERIERKMQEQARDAGLEIVSSQAYKNLVASGALDTDGAKFNARLGQAMNVEQFKTLVTGGSATSAGAFHVPNRLPGYLALNQRPNKLSALITIGQTDSDTVEWVEQTSFTNNAAETPEATAVSGTSGTKPESGLSYAVRNTLVQTIAHWIPATRRALRDPGQMRTLIEQALRQGLDLRLEQQIGHGDGVGVNLRGLYNTPGIGSVQRNTGESLADGIHRAITAVRLSYQEPSAVGIHPLDFETIRLSRENTGGDGTGAYLFGGPASAGDTTLWGKPVVVSTVFEQGRPLIADYSQAVLWVREGVQVLASDSHADLFIRNVVVILAELAAAFGVLRPDAFVVSDAAA